MTETVHLPVVMLGKRAAEMLWEQITQDFPSQRQEVRTTPSVLRASVAPAAGVSAEAAIHEPKTPEVFPSDGADEEG